MRQKAELRKKILKIKKKISELSEEKGKLQEELIRSCGHSGNVIYWPKAWGEYTVVKYYQCLDCGLIELDQSIEHINTEGARRTHEKNRDLL